MAISGGDGSIILTTKVDDQGLKQGTQNMRSEAAKLAAEYRKAGLSQSEAMKKAWSEIERTNKETKKTTQSTKEYGKQAQKSGSTAKKAFSGVGRSLKSLAIVAASAFSVYKLVGFGKEAINLASDLQEVQNVVDVAFDDMAYRMEQFADTAIETFGISKLTAKQTGSSYMAMAKGMQIADEAAADMALTLTGLSADMASFYNIRQEEARTALSAVFTGETETLKRYGILITEVNLQEYARQQGITKSINAMTQQEKVMLRYQYILQATQLAQGDFVRTQDSWANQTRILSERWKEMQTAFGEAFMTIGVLVLPVINSMISGLTRIAQIAQIVAQWIYKIFTGKELKSSTSSTNAQAQALSGVGTSANEAADAMDKLGKSTNKAGKEAKKSLAAFDDLQILSSNDSDAGGSSNVPEISTGGIGGIGEISGIGEAFNITPNIDTSNIESGFKKIGEIAQNLSKIVANIWDSSPVQSFVEANKQALLLLLQFTISTTQNIGKNFSETFMLMRTDMGITLQNIEMLWTSVWEDLGNSTQTKGPALIESVNSLFDSIWSTAFQPYILLISKTWKDFSGSLLKWWNKYGSPLIDSVFDFTTTMTNHFQKLYDDIIEPIITPLLEDMAWLWEHYLSEVVDDVLDFVAELTLFVTMINNKFIVPIVNFITGKLSPAFASISTLVSGVFSTVVAFISSSVSSILKILTGIIQFITGIFTGDWKKAWEGVKNIFSGIWTSLSTLVKTPLNLIIDALNSFIAGINKIKWNLPNWDILGDWAGKTFAINIPKIPKLAQGAVIPGGREFLTVLGDQPAGQTNIETPLETMIEAFNIALNNRGDSGTVKEEHYYLNETELMSVIYRLVKGGERLKGDSLINGGIL